MIAMTLAALAALAAAAAAGWLLRGAADARSLRRIAIPSPRRRGPARRRAKGAR